MTGTPLNQIAFSVSDLQGTCNWYQQVFGLVPAGGTESFKGYLAEKVQGVSGARSTCWWLVDAQGYFQLEFFEFERPVARPLAQDNRLSDIGYRMVGFHVADFDGLLKRLQNTGVTPLTDAVGEAGSRRVCIRDPEGVLLELMEDDPLEGRAPSLQRPEIPVVARSVTVSVADLEKSRHYFVEVLGMQVVPDLSLHQTRHHGIWELAGAARKELLLQAGGVLVELVEYEDPPGRKPVTGYRISDQGVLNIALGFRSQAEFNRMHRRCRRMGIEGNWRPLHLGAWSVVYVNDEQGFSVELLMVRPWYDGFMGFRPKALPNYTEIKRMKNWNTAIISGGGSGIGLRIAEMLLSEGTAVGIIDRSDCEAVSEQLQRMALAHNTRVLFGQADVCDSQGLEATVSALVAELGAPQLAINSAGIQIAKPFDELKGEEFERVVNVNLVGSRNFAAAILPHMQRGGQLALIASLAGIVPTHSYTAYNASKFGVVGLAGALRLEYIARGIEVSAVCPPEVDTPMIVEERKNLPEVAAKLKDTAGTLDADKACQLIMAQVRRRRPVVIPGIRAYLVARFAQICPGLLRWFSERIVLSTP
jgi:NAD(P)-dependent dehydrogenase (short-subunit alcohol dehydrogenase family)/catechol 2,3-dioxygenase-like lactoylglutathione lyase family enzyme